MNIFDLNLLSEYNTRVSKGIMHTPEYAAQMRQIQAQFNKEKAETK